MRWRTADGAMARLSVNEISRSRILELAMAAVVMECIGPTADEAITRLSVNEVSRRRLLELAMVAGKMECVGARLIEL